MTNDSAVHLMSLFNKFFTLQEISIPEKLTTQKVDFSEWYTYSFQQALGHPFYSISQSIDCW